jgi:hypothetical protein
VAARLGESADVRVEMKAGGLGELRVEADGRDLYDAGRFWYPRPGTILAAVERKLGR